LRQLNLLEQFASLHQGNYRLEHLFSEVLSFDTLQKDLPNCAIYFRLTLIAEQLDHFVLMHSHAPEWLSWVLVNRIEQTVQKRAYSYDLVTVL
jgi:hypothetical protein